MGRGFQEIRFRLGKMLKAEARLSGEHVRLHRKRIATRNGLQDSERFLETLICVQLRRAVKNVPRVASRQRIEHAHGEDEGDASCGDRYLAALCHDFSGYRFNLANNMTTFLI